ncbi:MAG: TraR/DksA family transcriptional regulator [Spirochaetia bacterium]|nr:TraR/DksA family transcriptional regulator [Spirochaetia bacterium]
MVKSPYTKKELQEFKELLLDKKSVLIKEIQDQSEEVTSEKLDEPGDLVDMATELLDQEMNLSLTTAESNTIKEINEALERIEKGTYGICIDSGEPISKARLKAVPEAKRTLEAQEKFDKKQKDQKKRSSMA